MEGQTEGRTDRPYFKGTFPANAGTAALTRYSYEDFLFRTICGHFFTEKRSNKVKHRTWNSIRFKFVKKISSPNSVKAFDISSTTARVARDLLKSLAILLDTTIRRSAVDWEDLKLYWKLQKKGLFLQEINKPIIYNFFKNLTTTERRLTGQ